jgi:ubiquinone/menaquinone biosynthesis C-methylase UbiE
MSSKQKNLWDNHWECQQLTNSEDILNSRFTQEAYHCIKKFITEKDRMILEAGCGTGRFCNLLAKDFPLSQILGIDVASKSLKIADRLKKYVGVSNVRFEKGDLFKLSYPNNYFDVVFNEGVIEHYRLKENPNYIDALREMIRVTKKGGKIIVGVPNWYNFPHTVYKWILKISGEKYIYGYEKSFRHSELMSLFHENGLSDIEISGFYPSHGFYRLRGKGFRIFFTLLGRITDIQSCPYNDRFGIEIVAKGIKL